MSGRILTVIMRNDAPLIYTNDSPTYRTVQIELTEDQVSKIVPLSKEEAISKCWIEPERGA